MLTTTRIAFRDARRSLWRFRATSVAAVLILALSICAGTVTFAVVDTVVLRPLPYSASERLVDVFGTTPKDFRSVVSPTDYYTWRESASSFEGLAAYRQWPFRFPGTSDEVTMVIATASLFDVLRVKPVIGTTFTADHETPGRDAVGVISHGTWTRRFGGDPSVLGQTLRTPTGVVTIIGVMPQDFSFPVEAMSPVAVWRPFAPKAEERVLSPGGGRVSYLQVVGRLRDGVTLDGARADIDRIYAAQVASHPEMYRDWRPRTEFLRDSLTHRVGGWMRLVLGAVAVLVLIGCVNVSNLLLTRAARRARDISLRISLGATRVQVVVSLLVESVLLTAIAAGVALLAAGWILSVVKAALPAEIVRAADIQLDLRVLAVCAAGGLVAALLAGAVPAWHAARVALSEIIKEGASTLAAPPRRRWQTNLLLAQVALVTALVVASTLLVGSFINVLRVDLGFSRHNLAGVRLMPAIPEGPAQAASVRDFYSRVLDAARTIEGVSDVALLAGGQLPLYRGFTTARISAPASAAAPVSADFRRVSDGYFAAAGIRLIDGRSFDSTDAGQQPIVIDDLAARHFFPDGRAVGNRIAMPGQDPVTVVGVVANVKLLGPEGTTQPQIYRPLTDQDANRVLLIRTSGPVAAVAPQVTATLASLMPPRSGRVTVDVVDDRFRALTADRRFNAGVMTALALLSLVIAVSGVYATTASMVAQQRKEIGIRMALGASGRAVIRTVAGRTARPVIAGTLGGLAIGWAASGIFRSVVFGIEPTNVLVYAVPAIVIACGGAVAALLPALKAAKIDPLITLRTEN